LPQQKGILPMPHHLKRCALILLAATLLAQAAPAVHAQSAPPATPATQAADTAAKVPSFDVISIRPNKDNAQMSGNGSFRMRVGSRSLPDGYSASNIDLKSLIANAYGVRPDQISGGPDWSASYHYDIEAKVVPADGTALQPLTKEQRILMLRSLLADRFKLDVHTETKEQPIYELVVARNGPKLQPAKPDQSTRMTMNASGKSTMETADLSALVFQLSSQLGRPVVDKTGLTGKYEIKLEWTRDQGPGSNDSTSTDSSGPSIFTAVQEQLGLKLNSTKGPVDTLVIDHVEQPTAN
jgi:uncharacterized protein (TIGR03435 family)